MKMKRLIAYGLPCFFWLLTLVASSFFPVGASNTSNALYYGILRITNNSTSAVSLVSTNWTVNTQSLINAGVLNSNLTNSALLSNAGIDTAYMPVYGTNITVNWVPAINANSIQDYAWYTGGTDMSSKLRYFPGQAGMTTNDAASLEPSYNYAFEWAGFIDTTNGTSKNLVYKQDAIASFVSPTVSGNITTRFTAATANTTIIPNATGNYTNIVYQFPAATFHWDKIDDPVGVPDDATTYVFPSNTGTQQKDAYNLPAPTLLGTYQVINTVRVNFRHYEDPGAVGFVQPYLLLGASESAGTEIATTSVWTDTTETITRPGGGSWSVSDLASLKVVIGMRNTLLVTYVTQVNVTIGYSYGETVSATGVSSAEHTIKTEQKTGISLDGVDDLISYGDPGDGDLDVGTGNFTFELVLAAQQDSTERGLIGKGNTVAPAAGLWSLYLTTTDRIGITLFNSTLAKSLVSISVANYLSDNLTHRIGVAVNRTSNIIDIYVDGVETPYVSDSLVTGGFSAADSLDTTKNFVIGGYETAADSANRLILTNPAKGTVYEARLYKRYIGASEMLAHVQGTFSDNSNLMLLTRFNEATGTTSTDSSGNGNTGTGYSGAGVSATWWARQRILVDGVASGTNDYSPPISVPNNANGYTFLQNYVMPYMEHQYISVNGTLSQNITWQYAATFTDQSGNGNNATPTFYTNQEHPNVSAQLIIYEPINQAQASTNATDAGSFIISQNVSPIPQMYTELGSSNFTGHQFWDDVLDISGTPRAFFWFPAISLIAIVLGLLTFRFSNSLLVEYIVILFLLGFFSYSIMPFYTAILFGIDGLAVVIAAKQYGF